jgi:transcription antitermination factor NusA-like protein
MTQWQGASIAAAVAQVVESLAAGHVGKRTADPQRRILVASYTEDFNYLWAWQKDLTDWLALGDRHIIVVWDGAPAPGRFGQYNVSEYLTPADWSVMMTLAAKKVPRVTIIDFESQRRQRSRTLQAFRHLRYMSPSPLAHVGEVDLHGLKQFFSALSIDASPPQPTPEDRPMLHALWNSMLGEGKGTHHAIANIVGPLLLLESMHRSGPENNSPIPAALRQLIRVLQAAEQEIAAEVQSDPIGNEPWFDFTKSLGLSADSVVLIDDLAENGWGDVLRAMLGLDVADPRLRVYLRPYAGGAGSGNDTLDLPGYLRRRLDWLHSDRKGHSAPPLLIPNTKNPLVFLDIRLFSQSALEHERGFYKDLLILAREFAALPTGWQVDLSDKALEPVARFAHGQADLESPDHHAALSLLPRLLALADPTLPIVLFSSTGRRAVVEPLIPCGNIIFDFEKPRLTGGDWNDAVDRARIGFKRAMDRATPLLRARSFLQSLVTTANKGLELAKQFLTSERDKPAKWKYAELYVDESGSPVDYVGGYAVLYENPEAAPAALYKALCTNELVWGASREETTDELAARVSGEQVTLSKASGVRDNERLRERIEATGRVLATNGPFAACVLTIPASRKPTSLPGGPDLAYREVASALIELFLYDWLWVISRAADCTMRVGVFLGTRMWKTDAQTLINCQWKYGCDLRAFDTPENPDLANADVIELAKIPPEEQLKVGHLRSEGKSFAVMPKRSVLKRPNKQVLAHTMDRSDVYGIIIGISRQRPHPGPVRCALAVTMLHGARPVRVERPFLPRQIHYASDDFLGVLRRVKRWESIPCLSVPLRYGFHGVANQQLDMLLRASRAIDTDEGLVEALRLLSCVWESGQLNDVTRWVSVRAASRVETMTGAEFLQLAQLLSPEPQNKGRSASNARSDSKEANHPNYQSVGSGHGLTQPATFDQSALSPQASSTNAASGLEETNLDSALTELLKRVVPGARRGEVQLKRAAIEGNRAIIAVAGKNAIAQTVGKKGAVIKQLVAELKVDRIDVIEWYADPVELARRALKEKGRGASIARNDEGQIEVRLPSWIQVTDEETRLVSSLIGSEILVVSKASGQTK